MSSSTFTPNLGVEKPATGMYANTWGNVANRSYDVIDAAIGGNTSIPIGSSAYTLTTTPGTEPTDGVNPLVIWTGPQSAPGVVHISPNTQKRLYLMSNQTTGGQPIAFSAFGASGTQFTLAAGHDAQIYCDGGNGNGAVANVAAAMANPQFNNVLVNGALTFGPSGGIGGSLNLTSLGLGGPTSVPDPLTINGLGANGRGQIRLVEVNSTNHGVILRNDGDAFYVMGTAANDPYGNYAATLGCFDFVHNVVSLGGSVPNASYGLVVPSIATGVIAASSLQTTGAIMASTAGTNNGYYIDYAFVGGTEGFGSGRPAGAFNQGGVTIFTANVPRMVITNAGPVGIGATPDAGHYLCVGGYIHSTAGGFVFPDGTVQSSAAASISANPTFATLTVTGAATIGQAMTVQGPLTVNTTLNVKGGYQLNGAPFVPGISGVTLYIGGAPQGAEPGINFAGQGAAQVTAGSHLSGSFTSVNIFVAATSDYRVKRNIRELKGGLDVIAQLHPVEAEYNGLGGTRDGERVVSVMAEELRKVLPGAVLAIRRRLNAGDIEETEILHIQTQEILFQMLLAIQQLAARP